ncbi:MAG: TetR/AcrR family transcriptional regulator [Erysipelotrichaceae bacterium]|nr:TetR/AcrR family transcriptional regulator [Erysipelotrichaceae bacterium]
MAQFLKEESRERIVDSARSEFLQHGYRSSSMRRIAFRSNMTVGNLYRYFKNKEELILAAVFPAYKELSELISTLTDGRISLESREFPQGGLSVEEIKTMISGLCSGFIGIYQRHQKEMRILMMRSDVNDRITDWFSELIRSVILRNYNLSEEDGHVRLLAQGYAAAIFSGLKEIMNRAPAESPELPKLAEVFLNSFVSLLDNDLQDHLGGTL